MEKKLAKEKVKKASAKKTEPEKTIVPEPETKAEETEKKKKPVVTAKKVAMKSVEAAKPTEKKVQRVSVDPDPEDELDDNDKNGTAERLASTGDELFFEKHRKALLDAQAPKKGEIVTLADILKTLLDIKTILQGTAVKTPETKTVKTGKVKLTTSQKKDRKEQMKAEFEKYTDGSALDPMKGSDIRMLGSAVGLKTFGVNPNIVRDQLKAMIQKKNGAKKK